MASEDVPEHVEPHRSGMALTAIMESANDAIVSIDAKGNVISWNRAAESLFGYTAEQIRGKPVALIIPQRYQKLHTEGIARVAATGQTRVIGKTVELMALRRDGTEFPVELSLSTWKLNEEMFFSGIIRDISDRKEAQRAIELSEMTQKSIMESANDAIVSIDSAGIVVAWNRAAERLFGYSADEIVGSSLTAVIPERYARAHTEGIERVSATGKTRVIGQTVELAGLRKDGVEFPIELSLATWMIDGQRFFSGIIRDITERKLSEKQIKEKTDELERVNAELALKNEQLGGLSEKLAKYLSRQVYESIFSGDRDVKVESYRRKLTVFFSDIQGFSELTDRMEAEDLSALLNSYLDEMSQIALRFGGTIDKFIGDGIMIFFGDPDTKGEKEDALACVRMALEMRRRLRHLQRKWYKEGISTPLHVRMGINTGFCTVGNFGSENRLDYTIVGGQVNIASRLESLAGENGILISHETYSLVRDEIACKSIGSIQVKGITRPVEAYEVIDKHDEGADQSTRIMGEFEGFSLSVNIDEMAAADRARARSFLEEVLARIRAER